MKLQTLVWFSSNDNPFIVSPKYCSDMECSCRDVWLRLTEIEPAGKQLPDPLTFEVRIRLENWTEPAPPPRPVRVEAMVRELLSEYPAESIQALVDGFHEQHAVERRLATHEFSVADRGKLIRYSDIVHPEGKLQPGRRFFLTHAGQDYLIEDHYCPTPECDCQQVHFEFWKRTPVPDRRTKAGYRIDVEQLAIVAFRLDGEIGEVRCGALFRDVLTAWSYRCRGLQAELQRRYHQIKAIGRRSFPQTPPARPSGLPQRVAVRPQRSTKRRTSRVGRNDPCPCGSGRKFKRCCARHTT